MSRTATPADVIAGAARWCVVEGDALDVVRSLPAARIDALVTDPPSGIAFMGAEWDRDKGGRAQWVAWLSEVLGLARAATRDGGRALVWSLPRTSHWTGCAVEDAGWSIESTVTHLFGTGWPKGKSQLKPAAETWWLARTGRSEALNIEAVRVGNGGGTAKGTFPKGPSRGVYGNGINGACEIVSTGAGRYPPNVVLSHSPGCVLEGTRKVRATSQHGTYSGTRKTAAWNGHGGTAEGAPWSGSGYSDPDGTETVDAWRCVAGCPVRELDAQAGARPGLTAGSTLRRGATSGAGLGYGGTPTTQVVTAGHDAAGEVAASRFFPQFPADECALFGYHAKPSRAERDAGVEGDGNIHSTVKSIALMSWLVRLVTGPDALVLDPFGGSGTTGAAALSEGRRVILVERDPRFAEIARQRCEHAAGSVGARQLSLLGGVS